MMESKEINLQFLRFFLNLHQISMQILDEINLIFDCERISGHYVPQKFHSGYG